MFKELFTEGTELSTNDFIKASKTSDYGFRVAAYSKILKEFLVSKYGKDSIQYNLPTPAHQPGEGKGYIKINGKKYNIDFDNDKAIKNTINTINKIKD